MKTIYVKTLLTLITVAMINAGTSHARDQAGLKSTVEVIAITSGAIVLPAIIGSKLTPEDRSKTAPITGAILVGAPLALYGALGGALSAWGEGESWKTTKKIALGSLIMGSIGGLAGAGIGLAVSPKKKKRKYAYAITPTYTKTKEASTYGANLQINF